MKTTPIHNHTTYESFWHAGVRYYRCTGCKAVRRAIKVEGWPEEVATAYKNPTISTEIS